MDSKSSYKSAQSKFYDWTKRWTQYDENSETNRTPDLVDLITIFQILGFSISHMDACDPQDMTILNCGERGLKINISCSHSGTRFVLEGANVCSCPQKMVDTAREIMRNPDGGQRNETYTNFRLLDVPYGEKLVIQTVLTHLVQMMHSASKHNDPNQNIKEKEQFQNLATESKTPMTRKSLEQYFTPEVPIQQEIIKKYPETEAPISPTRYRSLDTLTGKAPLLEFPEPGILTKNEVTTDTYNVPTVTLSSPNLSTPVKPSINTSSPVANVAILKQGYSKLLGVQDLLKEVIEFFDKAQEARELPKFSFDVSNIKGSNESLNAKKNVLPTSNSDSNLTKKNTKLSCRPSIRSVSTSKSTFSSSTITSAVVRANSTRRLSEHNYSPKSTNKPTSSGSKSQKYAHIKSTIPKINTVKKL